jgi:spermidine/putrescine transport system permease protein
MILPIYLSLDRLDPRLLEAGADLGASPLQTFRRIVLPLSMPGVVSGSVMVFLLACGAYVTPSYWEDRRALCSGTSLRASS